jgi:hypothetical protein
MVVDHRVLEQQMLLAQQQQQLLFDQMMSQHGAAAGASVVMPVSAAPLSMPQFGVRVLSHHSCTHNCARVCA